MPPADCSPAPPPRCLRPARSALLAVALVLAAAVPAAAKIAVFTDRRILKVEDA